jgi:sugar lactone lactonase YvrE
VSWSAPENEGYVGTFVPNDRLAGARFLDLGGHSGPEDAALGPDGMIYVSVHDGSILRLSPDGGTPETFASTGGRPLGLEFGLDGTLYVADAYRGLLGIDRDGSVRLLADKASDGSPILYADDLDVAADGTVYFSDASTRFSARDAQGTLEASILDLLEHSGSGRVLSYGPVGRQAVVIAKGLNFPNGVALTADERHLIVVETGNYRILKFVLRPNFQAEPQVLLENLPGFPDNANPGPDGTFWTGLVSQRNELVDRLSDKPFLRKLILRLPDFMKPKPTRYGFVLRYDADGKVIETLQDPAGGYALTTGAIDLPDGSVVITSLSEPRLAILPN